MSIEIVVSVSGKIPRRKWESYQPFFSVKECLPDGTTDEARADRHKDLQSQIDKIFSEIRVNILTEEITDQFKNLRFTKDPESGRMLPHVTDILYWDENFYIDPQELAQYAARGSANHAIIDHWIKTQKIDKSVVHRKDLIILKQGNLRLIDTLDDCIEGFLGFMEAYGKDITFSDGEFLAFNRKHGYCGSPDRVGTYKKMPAIFDFKTRGIKPVDFSQMASYANCDDKRVKGRKVMVGIPIDLKNKSKYGRPAVSTEIEKHFNLFLRDLSDFQNRFGRL